ncbi:hypothetical protein CHELA1G11_21014 [Hyphomicrobiales bacterium]|nr:hypothetical protein CHELA1G11_21014 [Hyphomicrobiales bacterium]CAH1692966.1 hypothetical protein CHELA1G2_21328 [Hyphomicrobiales bacterium]
MQPPTTSTAIGTGSKVFTTQDGRSFAVDRYVQIVSAANRAGRQMSGMVMAYPGTSLTVHVTIAVGSGTAADWLIYLSGPAGKGEPGDDADTPATVTNRGRAAVRDPRFRDLAAGTDGDDGDAAAIAIGDVTAVPTGSPPAAINVRTANGAVFNFALPQGEIGPAGPVIAGS